MKKNKKRKLPTWTHTPVYLALRAGIGAMMAADVRRNVLWADAFGAKFAGAPFNRKRLQRAIDHLEVAFPHWSYERRREYAVKAYQHLFLLAVETMYAPKMISSDEWAAHVHIGGVADALEHLLRGRPSILVTGHTGNWELLGYTMAALGFPMHALYRPLDLRPLDTWVRRTRERQGLYLVDKFGAANELPGLMDSGELVAFVADQNGGDRGLFVPFFNRLSSAYKTIGVLALKYRRPIICGQARRVVPGRKADEAPTTIGFDGPANQAFQYRIDIFDVIQPEEWDEQPDPLFYVTARYRRAIEHMVRVAPEQYLWMHRYWKSRPRHERLARPVPESVIRKVEQLPWTTTADVNRIVAWSEGKHPTSAQADTPADALPPGSLAKA